MLNNLYFSAVAIMAAVYVFASVPYGFILVRLLKGEDIRQFGSGNIGATNVARRLGVGWGVFVFLLDSLKGFIPVYWLSNFSASWVQHLSYIPLLAALVCVLAHNHSVFLKFRGGKGVSTSIGVIAALSVVNPVLRLPLFIALIVWILVFLAARIVALASLAAGAAFFFSCLFLHLEESFVLFSFVIFAFIVFRHSSNIKRLVGKKPS